MTKKHQRFFQLLLLLLFVLGAFWLNSLDVSGEMFEEGAARYGYLGVLIGAMLSGFNILVPIPIVAFFPFFLEIGLDTYLLVAVISIGMTVGDACGFVIGKSSRSIVDLKEGKITTFLLKTQKKHPAWIWFVYFLYAGFAPAPNEIIVMPGAYMGLRFREVIVPVFFGNVIFNALVAFGLVVAFS